MRFPAAPPAELTAVQIANALVRAAPSANVVVSMVSVAGASTAAPSPCTARMAMSSPGPEASPPTRLDTENSTRPHTKTRRLPYRSAAGRPAA
ncbi:hypothetical protein SALBM135S_07202 [Streptomyces alboniger]